MCGCVLFFICVGVCFFFKVDRKSLFYFVAQHWTLAHSICFLYMLASKFYNNNNLFV